MHHPGEPRAAVRCTASDEPVSDHKRHEHSGGVCVRWLARSMSRPIWPARPVAPAYLRSSAHSALTLFSAPSAPLRSDDEDS